MCGIVGYIGGQQATAIILEGLKKLEYRGYDSAGIATLSDNESATRRSEGSWLILKISLGRSLCREQLVSVIPAGQRMADLRKLMPIRTKPGLLSSYITAS